jgi:hypothetical protein
LIVRIGRAERNLTKRNVANAAAEVDRSNDGGPKEPAMDTEKNNFPPNGQKPIIDQMTDLAAQAAGTLAETAVKAAAKKAKTAVAKRLPRPVKKAAKTIAKAAKVPKKRVKKTAKKSSKRPPKSNQSKARRRTVGKKTATKVARKKAKRR